MRESLADFSPAPHRFSSWRAGISKQEIYTGVRRAFFGYTFLPLGKAPRQCLGVGVSLPIVLHVIVKG